MRKFLIASLVATTLISSTQAGPFGLFTKRGNYSNNTNGNNNYPVAHAFLGTATGVASYLASLGRIGHYGGNPYAYEGVGMGATPDQALRNCCNNGGVVADYGVCQGSNGMYYACKRYHGR